MKHNLFSSRVMARNDLRLYHLLCVLVLAMGLLFSCNLDLKNLDIQDYLGNKNKKITIKPLAPSIKVGKITNLIADWIGPDSDVFTWTSSATNIVSFLEEAGKAAKIMGISPGEATITATVGGFSAEVTVTVAQLISNITLAPKAFTLGVGGVSNIIPAVLPGDADSKGLTWRSGDEGIATVNNAQVTGVYPGTTTISASADGAAATVTITVLATPKHLTYQRVGTCPVDSTRLGLSWDRVAGASSYTVTSNQIPVAVRNTNAVTVSGLSPGDHTFEVKACDGGGCSQPATLTVTVAKTSLSNLIADGNIPSDFSGYDRASREVFSYYPGATVVAKYVREGMTGNGNSYAGAAGNVKTVLEGIQDASATRVYAVLVAPGTYDAGEAMAMKNHVAIVGGVRCMEAGEAPTVLSGGKTHRVFENRDVSNAVLYGVTIAEGIWTTRSFAGGMYNSNSSPVLTRVIFTGNEGLNGGGMFNYYSSPVLNGVIFSNNTANFGGGIYQYFSSPVLNGVIFTGNTARRQGGGILNSASSPILNGVTFSRNTATRSGGGIFSDRSSPVLVGVTFFENSSDQWGGGMYNTGSSPALIGVTFFKNRATTGGGMINNNDGKEGPLVVNTILWENRAAEGNQFYFRNDIGENGVEKLRLYHSLVEGGLPGYSSGTTVTSLNGGGFGSGEIHPIAVYFSPIIVDNPRLFPLADNGGVPTHAFSTGSSAVNQGLYVRRSAAPTKRGCLYKGENQCDIYTYYFSEDNNIWYSDPALSDVVTPPADAVDLTATDATGYPRTGRPDLGAYEAR